MLIYFADISVFIIQFSGQCFKIENLSMIPFELHDTKFDREQIYILSLVTSKYLLVRSPVVVRQIQQLYVQLDT